jgi:MSHA biogenesis protein MshK
MAGGLTPQRQRLAAPLALLLMTGLALAQLADPTKPPLSVSAPVAETAGAEVAGNAGLRSVILRKGGKPAALINGEVVELGGKVGEARLIRIREDAVVLKGPEGEETLRLTPAAEKKVGAGGTAKRKNKGADQ